MNLGDREHTNIQSITGGKFKSASQLPIRLLFVLRSHRLSSWKRHFSCFLDGESEAQGESACLQLDGNLGSLSPCVFR